jgi:hypothetical protein
MRTLLDGDEHDVADTHYARKQCEQTNYPQGSAYDAYTHLHLHVLCIAVPQPETALVFRMYLVRCVQALTIFLLKVFVSLFCCQSMKRKLYITGIVGVCTENALDGRVG